MDRDGLGEIHHYLSTYTLQIVKQSLERRNASVPRAGEGSWIHFLGTGGNPINLMSQHRQTGGFVLRVGGACLCVDPGPGALVHAAREGLDLSGIDAVYVSHGHTDHCGDAGVVIEAMCQAMSRRRGMVFSPVEVLEDGRISRFHQGKAPSRAYPGGPQEVVPAEDGGEVAIGDCVLRFVRAYHGGENYGFILEAPGLRVGYTSDTSYLISVEGSGGPRPVAPWDAMSDLRGVVEYREDLKNAFYCVDVLVANVSYHSLFATRCLTAVGLSHLLSGSRVGLAIMTHLDEACFRPRDISQRMAEYVEGYSGVSTRVAQDNEVISLEPQQGIPVVR
ncbi:MAG: MBL fold metallo-hydrolase [Bacillota bacterium]